MKLLHFCFISLLLTCFACSNKENLEASFKECASIADLKILSVSEKQNACFYLDVYRYRSKFYMICECCVCDKAAMAVDCDGVQLCDFTENCLVDFYLNAEFLFSVAEP